MTAPDVAAAALEVWRTARSAAGEQPTGERVDRVRHKLADPSSRLLVAQHGGRIVGMVLAEQFRVGEGEGGPLAGWGHVSMVFVDPDAQGAGVGRALLERLIDEGPWTSLSVWTRRSNVGAQALYRGTGFVPTGELGTTPAGEVTERWERQQAGASCLASAASGTVVARGRSEEGPEGEGDPLCD